MNELEKEVAELKRLGATPQEIAEYIAEHQQIPGVKPDATSALQRERENPTGDWEAIPDALKTAAGIGLSMIPAERGIVAGIKGASKIAPAVGAAVAELPVANRFVRAAKAGRRAWQAGKAVQKIEEAAAPKSLDDIVGNLELLPEAPPAPAQTLEEVLSGPSIVRSERYRTGSGALQKGAPKARFDMIAERQAAMRGKPAAPELTIEEVLADPANQYAMTLEHIKKGGSMKSAADALKLMRAPK